MISLFSDQNSYISKMIDPIIQYFVAVAEEILHLSLRRAGSASSCLPQTPFTGSQCFVTLRYHLSIYFITLSVLDCSFDSVILNKVQKNIWYVKFLNCGLQNKKDNTKKGKILYVFSLVCSCPTRDSLLPLDGWITRCVLTSPASSGSCGRRLAPCGLRCAELHRSHPAGCPASLTEPSPLSACPARPCLSHWSATRHLNANITSTQKSSG